MQIKNDMSLLIKLTVLGICLSFNLFAAATLLFGDQSIGYWQDVQADSDNLDNKLIALDEKNSLLSEEIRLLQSDNAYLEKVIRQELKYVKDTEILYVFEHKAAPLPILEVNKKDTEGVLSDVQ